MNKDINFLREKTIEIKKKCLDICVKGGYGHPTSAYSCAEICVALYYRIMNYDIKNPNCKDRDRFIMSKNHASVIVHPILHDLGIMKDEEYNSIMQEGSIFTSHTNINHDGQDFSGGALGIGLGMAVGLALGAKLNRQSWYTFAVIGDAECYEGSMWEAIFLAGHQNLNNLVVFLDRNGLGITDFTENMLALEPLEDKFLACNWEVKTIDGHSIEEILDALKYIRTRPTNKPLCIIAKTIKGNGVEFMENKALMHGTVPKGEDLKKAYKELLEGECY